MSDVREQLASKAPVLSFRFGPCTWDFVRIPAGRFWMGSPLDEAGRDEGEPEAFQASITRPFYLLRHPATQAQYVAVMGKNPSEFRGERLPIDQLTFVDALAFSSRVATMLGMTVMLPSEAQWEYACRAGTTTPGYGGAALPDLDRIAWYRDNSGGTIQEVGLKQPNAWGLYDMLGNVFEPCVDNILSFDSLKREDPLGACFPDHAIARGGAWMSSAARCRAAGRMQTNDMFGGLGVRLLIPA